MALTLVQWIALPLAADPGHAATLTSAALHTTNATLTDRAPDLNKRVRLDAAGRPAYLARFSDGPRNVPEARGTAQLQAKKLGIGATDKARVLLHGPPPAALVASVHGAAPRDLLWPVVDGKFGRGFGLTRQVRRDLPHNGVDIGAPAGSVVRAVADGLVVYSDNGLRGFGNCVIILHKNGWLSLYAHGQRTTVQAGYEVKRGERIALVGQTGFAWGPHLHFELRDNGRLRDPERLFVGRKSSEVNGPLVALSEPAGKSTAQRTAATRGRSPAMATGSKATPAQPSPATTR